MIFVIPQFAELFKGFGADLPHDTVGSEHVRRIRRLLVSNLRRHWRHHIRLHRSEEAIRGVQASD